MDAPAILLMGPTGAGKTDLAVALAGRFPVEIVSVDSAMVYRGMDIGTAKPDPVVRAEAPHHLIDIVDPAEPYSTGRFLQDAAVAIERIRSRGKVPLLVGGTMLYFRALQSGIARLPPADPQLRQELAARAEAVGWPAMHRELARLDPEAAARIRPGDRQRIQRALEVIRLTGRPLSEAHREDLRTGSRRGDLKVVLAPADRKMQARRIAERFERMMELGLLEEVRSLYERGDLGPEMPSIRAVGYRQLWAHLAGEISLPEAVDRAVIATRQLARRQLTWLRVEPEAEWFDPLEPAAGAQIQARVAAWLRAGGYLEPD